MSQFGGIPNLKVSEWKSFYWIFVWMSHAYYLRVGSTASYIRLDIEWQKNLMQFSKAQLHLTHFIECVYYIWYPFKVSKFFDNKKKTYLRYSSLLPSCIIVWVMLAIQHITLCVSFIWNDFSFFEKKKEMGKKWSNRMLPPILSNSVETSSSKVYQSNVNFIYMTKPKQFSFYSM